MSRVFEALNKASEEKKQRAEAPVEKKETDLTGLVSADIVEAAPDLHVNRNGHDGRSSWIPSLSPNGQRTWRERVEEVLFGWDLRRYHNYPIVALEKDSPASEQYKILREQIKRLRSEAGVRVFSITSPVKKDGKTTVAVNLAAALALDFEKEVLLIDGDLRAPGIHRFFNLPQSPGLADYLSSNSYSEIKALVQESYLPGLKILSAGKRSDLSSELLAKEKMKHLMDEVRSEFPEHEIIVDCPPILSTPDPLVIARQVDGILMVVRAGKTPRDYLTKALQTLNSNKVMGVVLNGADLGISSKYYYYSTNGKN